jgi:hypothetical protein
LRDLEKAYFTSNLPKWGTADAQAEKGNLADLYYAGTVKLVACISLDDCNNVKISRTIDPYKISTVPRRAILTPRNVSCN